MLKRRILINRTHDAVLRFLPPFILQQKHVDHAIDTLDAVSDVGGEIGQDPCPIPR